MVEVTKEEFFAAIGPRDVSPTTELPNKTLWRMRYTGAIVGESTPRLAQSKRTKNI